MSVLSPFSAVEMSSFGPCSVVSERRTWSGRIFGGCCGGSRLRVTRPRSMRCEDGGRTERCHISIHDDECVSDQPRLQLGGDPFLAVYTIETVGLRELRFTAARTPW